MENRPTDIPFLSNIGLMLTYKCSVACPHCIVEAGPHRKEMMSLENAFKWSSEASEYGDRHIKGLALTGGEPFFDMDNLKSISGHGRKLGFVLSVVTNAFWASTKEQALKVLSQVPDIQMISFSTDVYHLKSIPFENIKNGIWAANQLGLLYNIAVCTDSEEDEQYKKIIKELSMITDKDSIRTAITFPVGRAGKRSKSFNYRMSSEPTAAACTMASSPVIFPDGKVMACIGPVMKLPFLHPLLLGNLNNESLTEILDKAESNPILHAIRVWGPHKIVSMLHEYGLGDLTPKEYIADCTCDVCYKLLNNDKIRNFLKILSENEEFNQKIAFARVHYLNENRMAEILFAQSQIK